MTNTTTVSFPVFSILTAVLVVLKLVGTISISWWWVFAPMWIPALIALGVFAIALVVVAIKNN